MDRFGSESGGVWLCVEPHTHYVTLESRFTE